MNSFIDLHMHSRFSDDGEFTPAELVAMCKERDISVMAIADHNSVRAVREGRQAAQDAGITFIAATEMDCTFEGTNLHVLGYGIDCENAGFAQIERAVTEQGIAASEHMLRQVQELGFDLAREQLMEAARGQFCEELWTGELFAEVLLHDPRYRAHPLLAPYRENGARSDNPYVNFYWDYFSQGKPCYVAIEYPTMQSVVKLIHESGGQAVLAHPGVNLRARPEMLTPILKCGMDGVEAFSSYHTAEQAAHFYEQARQHGCFVTCGSDFHGKTKPAVHLGQHGCTLADEDMRAQLQKLL